MSEDFGPEDFDPDDFFFDFDADFFADFFAVFLPPPDLSDFLSSVPPVSSLSSPDFPEPESFFFAESPDPPPRRLPRDALRASIRSMTSASSPSSESPSPSPPSPPSASATSPKVASVSMVSPDSNFASMSLRSCTWYSSSNFSGVKSEAYWSTSAADSSSSWSLIFARDFVLGKSTSRTSSAHSRPCRTRTLPSTRNAPSRVFWRRANRTIAVRSVASSVCRSSR